MLASKESVREALKRLEVIVDGIGGFGGEDNYALYIRQVLEACERKLPTEAAYQKEKERKRRYAKDLTKKGMAELNQEAVEIHREQMADADALNS